MSHLPQASAATPDAREGTGHRLAPVRLLVDDGLGAREVCVSAAPGLTVGRDPTCDVRLDRREVSRVHARLDLTHDATITDLGGVHGTSIAGEHLAPGEPVPLATGAVVAMGAALFALAPQVTVVSRVIVRPSSPTGGRKRTSSVPPPLEQAASHFAVGGVFARLLDLVVRLGADANLLLCGELGAGKGAFATLLHLRGGRREGPLCHVHCAALEPHALERTLFGSETDGRTTPGVLEAARGGTVVLESVGELPMLVQERLAEALRDGSFTRMGGASRVALEPRIVATTTHPLRHAVAYGTFRADLLERLGAVSVGIPPLRERGDEIEAIAAALLLATTEGMPLPARELSPDAVAALRAQPWVGNLRELRAVLEHAALLGRRRMVRSHELLFARASHDPDD